MHLILKSIIPYIVYQKYNNENSIVVSVNNLLFSLNCLKNHYNYKYSLLSCITGIDLLGSNYRFSVVYDLLSLTYNSRIRVKVFVNEVTSVPSLCDNYINANW